MGPFLILHSKVNTHILMDMVSYGSKWLSKDLQTLLTLLSVRIALHCGSEFTVFIIFKLQALERPPWNNTPASVKPA